MTTFLRKFLFLAHLTFCALPLSSCVYFYEGYSLDKNLFDSLIVKKTKQKDIENIVNLSTSKEDLEDGSSVYYFVSVSFLKTHIISFNRKYKINKLVFNKDGVLIEKHLVE